MNVGGGFSKARLSRMHDTMARHVASGSVPGLITLISRRGETHVDAIGMRQWAATIECAATPSSASPL
jgi:hypothetical protein